MIEVKGTKTKAPEVDASQRYVLKSMDRKSRTPLALGVSLTGLALYLKSIFPGWTRSEEEQSPAEDDVRADTVQSSIAQIQPVAVSNDTEAVTETTPPVEHGSGSGSKQAALQPSVNFTLTEPLSIDFLQPEIPLNWGGPRPSPSPARPANDNRSGDPIGSGGNSTSGNIGDPGSATGGDPFPDDDGEPADDDDPGNDSPPNGNRAPRVAGPVYLMDVVGCATLAIGLTDLLRDTQDPDGDTLSVTNLAVSSGTLTQAGGGWVFQSSPQVLGPVTITYQITDGEFTVDQVAYFSVVKPPLIGGTDADDMLFGSMCADEIDGADGDDNIDGRAGGDVIVGGKGDDHIVAGDGDDVVFGGDGNDIVFGGAGDDALSGGSGNDRLFGENGGDVIFGDDGDDRLSGGDGQDLLSGGDGNDIAYGDAGNDTIEGGAGDDVLLDGDGEDLVLGGDGRDHVVAALDSDADVYDGGGDLDTLDYTDATEGIVVDLVNGIASGVEIGEDTITGFENLLGGEGDDHFIAGAEPVVFAGGGGDNTFEFSVPDASHQAPPVLHEILDFEVGDRIRISKYDIFEEVIDELEDQFERIYGDGIDDDDAAIRYRHDRTDEMDRTVIEADLDNDDIWETTIALQGHHVLVVVEST